MLSEYHQTLHHLGDVRSRPDSSMDWFCWENLNRKPWNFPSNIVFSCKISLKPIHWYQVLSFAVPSGYDIHSLPWKIPPFWSSVNHLFLWAMASMAMLNNQRLVELEVFVCRLVPTISIHLYACGCFLKWVYRGVAGVAPNHQKFPCKNDNSNEKLGSPMPFGFPTQRWSNSLGRSIDASPSPRVHQRHGGVKDG